MRPCGHRHECSQRRRPRVAQQHGCSYQFTTCRYEQSNVSSPVPPSRFSHSASVWGLSMYVRTAKKVHSAHTRYLIKTLAVREHKRACLREQHISPFAQTTTTATKLHACLLRKTAPKENANFPAISSAGIPNCTYAFTLDVYSIAYMFEPGISSSCVRSRSLSTSC